MSLLSQFSFLFSFSVSWLMVTQNTNRETEQEMANPRYKSCAQSHHQPNFYRSKLLFWNNNSIILMLILILILILIYDIDRDYGYTKKEIQRPYPKPTVYVHTRNSFVSCFLNSSPLASQCHISQSSSSPPTALALRVIIAQFTKVKLRWHGSSSASAQQLKRGIKCFVL